MGGGKKVSKKSHQPNEMILALQSCEKQGAAAPKLRVAPNNLPLRSGPHFVLKAEGIDIARRTVAKYREALRIPSSAARRSQKRAASGWCRVYRAHSF